MMLTVLLFTALIGPAPMPALVVGSKAPAFAVTEWSRGPGVEGFKRGQVYLIDFWATWCPPCVSSMPHLSELQAQYGSKGLHVMGITQIDRWGGTRPNIAKVTQSLSRLVSVGIDSPAPKAYQGVFNGKMECAYMQAAGVQGIPSTFLIDRNGRIAYIGIPSLVDDTLRQVMAGTFDIEAAAANYRITKPLEARLDAFIDLIRKDRRDEAFAIAQEIASSKADTRTLWLVGACMVDMGNKNPSTKELELAFDCARRAVDASKRKDPGMLATLATLCDLLQQNAKARQLIHEAISLAAGEQRDQFLKLAAEFGG